MWRMISQIRHPEYIRSGELITLLARCCGLRIIVDAAHCGEINRRKVDVLGRLVLSHISMKIAST